MKFGFRIIILLITSAVANLLRHQENVPAPLPPTASGIPPPPASPPPTSSFVFTQPGPPPPPPSPPQPVSPLPFSVSTQSSASPPVQISAGPRCSKGYTYCGYMLQQNGHNFTPELVNKTYCDGIEGSCLNGAPKTKPDEAVYLCMNENPPTIQMFCACSGKCLNEAASNNIAHCDSPCSQKCS